MGSPGSRSDSIYIDGRKEGVVYGILEGQFVINNLFGSDDDFSGSAGHHEVIPQTGGYGVTPTIGF